jgi:glucokinase-like ROK family protein
VSPQNSFRTGDHSLVREINLSAIMHHLRENAPVSRSGLAELTGLNKTTVSSLVRELIDYDLVRELQLDFRGVGRPAVLLQLNPDAGCIISCEIGVDFVSAVRTNFAAEILWRHQISTHRDLGQRTIIERTLAVLHQAIESGRSSCHRLLGLAVGVPGLVDENSGTLLFAPNLGWENVPLQSILSQAIDAHIIVDNEANLAALGEYFFGAAEHAREMLYISAGVGLGGAIVRGGHLFRGSTGVAGEFGHMTMDPNGALCSCGNRGCWETQVSQSALFNHIRQAIGRGRISIIPDMLDGDLDRLTVATVVDAAQVDDGAALEALAEVGHHLGIGIASLINALNPELVVFGGILSLAGSFLMPIVQEELQRRALRWNETASEVRLARHGFDASVIGGVAKIHHAVLTEPAAFASGSRSMPVFMNNRNPVWSRPVNAG